MRKPTKRQSLYIFLIIAGYFGFIIWGSTDPFGEAFHIEGAAMEPTYVDGQTVRAHKIDPNQVNRGDVIVFDFERADKQYTLIKRVVGLPGDTIQLSEGELLITTPNGEVYEPYPDDQTDGQSSEVVTSKHFYVVGDSRQSGASLDSRNQLGLVPFSQIRGVVR